MVEPKKLGRFLACDEHGYILPDVSRESIGDAWKPLVDFVSKTLMDSGQVQAVYIRGSIPRGLAIEGVSDADFIYVSQSNLKDLETEIESTVSTQFPFLRGLELLRLDQAALNKIYSPQNRPYFHMLLKTQGLHLAGADIAESIAPFKAGLEMVSHVFSLQREYSKLPVWLEEDRQAGKEIETRKWFSRRVVRAGLEITLNRCNRFTRDLFLCYEQFAQFYPSYKEDMQQVLVNCLNGLEDPMNFKSLVDLLQNESSNLLAEELSNGI